MPARYQLAPGRGSWANVVKVQDLIDILTTLQPDSILTTPSANDHFLIAFDGVEIGDLYFNEEEPQFIRRPQNSLLPHEDIY